LIPWKAAHAVRTVGDDAPRAWPFAVKMLRMIEVDGHFLAPKNGPFLRIAPVPPKVGREEVKPEALGGLRLSPLEWHARSCSRDSWPVPVQSGRNLPEPNLGVNP